MMQIFSASKQIQGQEENQILFALSNLSQIESEDGWYIT